MLQNKGGIVKRLGNQKEKLITSTFFTIIACIYLT